MPSAPFAEFWGVSCTSRRFCVAVGFTTLANGDTTPLAEKWNGTKWSIAASPKKRNGTLAEVSCASAGSCSAVGTYMDNNGNNHLYAEDWNGKRWSRVSTPSPSKSEPNQLMGADCSSAQACTAVGLIAPFGTSNSKNLIESGGSGR